MHERALTCDVGEVRPDSDWHQIDWSASDSYLKSECCQQNCYSVMNERALTCDAGEMRDEHDYHYMLSTNQTCPFGEVRGYYDWHRPDDAHGNDWSSVNAQEECCVASCHDYMNDQQLQCPDNTRGQCLTKVPM